MGCPRPLRDHPATGTTRPSSRARPIRSRAWSGSSWRRPSSPTSRTRAGRRTRRSRPSSSAGCATSEIASGGLVGVV